MRAIVFDSPGSFSLSEVPDPDPGPDEIVVRVEAVGICGTDVHVLDGEFEPTVFPITPVTRPRAWCTHVGDRVDGFAIGDRVLGRPVALLRPLCLLRRRPGQPLRELGRRRRRPDQRFNRRARRVPGRQRVPPRRLGGSGPGGPDRAAVVRHPRFRPTAPSDGRALSDLRCRHDGSADGAAGPAGGCGLGQLWSTPTRVAWSPPKKSASTWCTSQPTRVVEPVAGTW